MPKVYTKEEILKKAQDKTKEVLSDYLSQDHPILLEFHRKMCEIGYWTSDQMRRTDNFEKKQQRKNEVRNDE